MVSKVSREGIRKGILGKYFSKTLDYGMIPQMRSRHDKL